MNLFDKAKVKEEVNLCRSCKMPFKLNKGNRARGWGLCCSKSCATTYRNKLSIMSNQELTQEIRSMKLDQLGI